MFTLVARTFSWIAVQTLSTIYVNALRRRILQNFCRSFLLRDLGEVSKKPRKRLFHKFCLIFDVFILITVDLQCVKRHSMIARIDRKS